MEKQAQLRVVGLLRSETHRPKHSGQRTLEKMPRSAGVWTESQVRDTWASGVPRREKAEGSWRADSCFQAAPGVSTNRPVLIYSTGEDSVDKCM